MALSSAPFFPRLASHFEDFITYVAYVLVSNLALKARDHGGNVVNDYIILHHDASGYIMLPYLKLICQLPLRIWLQL